LKYPYANHPCSSGILFRITKVKRRKRAKPIQPFTIQYWLTEGSGIIFTKMQTPHDGIGRAYA